MRITEAHQVPNGYVSRDIFKLPCIDGCVKDKENGYAIYFTKTFIRRRYVFPGDWLCKDDRGIWQVLTDEEYKTITTP